MTDSNRMRLTHYRQSALSEVITTPRMRTAVITGESLNFTPTFVMSDDIRSDGMNEDPTMTGQKNGGGINYNLIYPADTTLISNGYRSMLRNAWVMTPARDNDGTADSVITDILAATQVATVTAGAAFVTGQIVRFSGFSNAANNGVFKCTTGSATVPAFVGAGMVNEPAPAAAARMKVVGFEGAAGDITALADGLGSTALNFTTLGLAVGQWIKIGATAAGTRFATAALNSWARITAITATKLTLDNLPVGWATDAGAAKTIRVFFGDQIKNGQTVVGLTLERGFMGQALPNYIEQNDMVVNQGDVKFESEKNITGSFDFLGLRGDISTVPRSATPDPSPQLRKMSANVHVGRIAENGALLSSASYVKAATISVNNNLRVKPAIAVQGGFDIGLGDCDVSVTFETYFGDATFFQKLLSGTPSNINIRQGIDSQHIVFAVPRMTYTDGNPNAGAKNQDVMLPLKASASYDPLTQAHLIIDRLEYVEN